MGKVTASRSIHSGRLLLRPFLERDVNDALAYRNDPEFSKFLPHVPYPFTRSDAEAFVTRNGFEPWTIAPIFAVVLDGSVIGTVNFEINTDTRAAMLGYAIGRTWWRQGIATEASRAALTWAISDFDPVRIWGSTDARNARSRRVLEKLGMKQERVLADHHRGRHGENVDEVVYAIQVSNKQVPGFISPPRA